MTSLDDGSMRMTSLSSRSNAQTEPYAVGESIERAVVPAPRPVVGR